MMKGVAVVLVVVALLCYPIEGKNKKHQHIPEAPKMGHRPHHEMGRFVLLHDRELVTHEEVALEDNVAYQVERAKWPADMEHEYYVSLDAVDPVKRAEAEADIGKEFAAYVPHNTFLLVGTHEDAVRAQTARHVFWVGHRSAEHKMAPNAKVVSEEEAEFVREKGFTVMLNLGKPDRTLEEAALIAAQFCDALKAQNVAATCVAVSNLLMEVDLADAKDAARAAEILASHPQVHFVERQAVIMGQNDLVRQLILDRSTPANNPLGPPLDNTSPALDGQGEIIGLADTGVDFDNCFFDDPNQALTFNQVISNHRKFSLYDTTRGNARDDFLHGTHMAGTLVGEVYDGAPFDVAGFTADTFRGLVENAKLAFVDINDGGASYNISDVSDLYDITYRVGAKVNVYGFGGASNFYSTLGRLTDEFAFVNKDWVGLFPMGNQLNSVNLLEPLYPAAAKNSIGVGSSFSDVVAFTRSTGRQGNEFEFLHRFWHEQLCGGITTWYFHQPFCAAQGWSFPCDAFRDEFCNQDGGFGPPGDATKCCDKPFLRDVCCQETVEENWNDNAGFLFSPLAVDGNSIRGPIKFDERIGVDILAPGTYVVSARSDQDTSTNQCGNDAIITQNGTSMATAVAGAAAVKIRQYFTSGYHPTRIANVADAIEPSAALVKAVMLHSGQPQIVLNANERQYYQDLLQLSLPNPIVGYGRIRLDRVLPLSGSTTFLTVLDNQVLQDLTDLSSTPIFARTYCFDVPTAATFMKVTLTWTDSAPVAGSGIALSNDLDLSILSQEQVTYKSNGLSTFDSVNPVEQITFEPISNKYTITVQAKRLVNNANQVPFSLVITTTGADITESTACLGFCSHRCSFRGFCNLQGICECATGYFGIDCSLSRCTDDCGENGYCDGLTGICECGELWGGLDCNTPVPEGDATVIVVAGTCKEPEDAVSIGVVIGASIGCFVLGLAIGFFIGGAAGIYWLIQRKKRKVAELKQRMAANQGGGTAPGGGGDLAAP